MLAAAVASLTATADATTAVVAPSGEAVPTSLVLTAASVDADRLSAVFLSAFTSDECEHILRWARELAERNASATSYDARYAGGGGEPWVSRSYVRAALPAWALQRVQDYVAAADGALWRLISPADYVEEPIVSSYARVSERPADRFDWHVDWSVEQASADATGRNLAVSVQLSAPSTYCGGTLTVGPRDIPRDQGALCVFPAAMPHRVAPVARGRRDALVVWMRGTSGGREGVQASLRMQRSVLSSAAWPDGEAPPAVLDVLARQLQMAGDWAGSVPLLQRAAALDPSSWESMHSLGVATREAGRHSEAVGAFEAALHIAPRLTSLQAELARTRKQALREGAHRDGGPQREGHGQLRGQTREPTLREELARAKAKGSRDFDR